MLKRAEGRPPVRCISDRAHMRRRRQGRRLLEKKYSYFSSGFRSNLDQFNVFLYEILPQSNMLGMRSV